MNAESGIPTDGPGQSLVVSPEKLADVFGQLLQRFKMFAAESQLVVDRLIESELFGYSEFGVSQFLRILSGMEMGNVDPRAQIVRVQDSAAVLVLDAGKGVGEVAASRAVQWGCGKARETGVATVVVRNGQSLGSPAIYARMAAAEGLIGFCVTSFGKSAVTTDPSIEPFATDAPQAWGIPVAGSDALVLEQAPTQLDRAVCEFHSLSQRDLAPHTAWGRDGQPTMDPEEAYRFPALDGSAALTAGLLPTLLSGCLAGARLPSAKRANPELDGAEHTFVLVDPAQFALDRPYPEAVCEWLDTLTSSVPDLAAVLPFTARCTAAERRRREGIAVNPDHRESLNKYLKRFKLDELQ